MIKFSSFFGGDKTEFPEEIIFKGIYPIIVGRTFSDKGFPITDNSLTKQFIGGWSDGFILQLNPNKGILDYASYIGGTGRDSVDDLYWNSSGNTLFVTGRTMSASISSSSVKYLQTDTSDTSWNGFIMEYFIPGI